MSLTLIIDKVMHIHFLENPFNTSPIKWIFCENIFYEMQHRLARDGAALLGEGDL